MINFYNKPAFWDEDDYINASIEANLPISCIDILNKLNENYEAYIVGGYIRDSILGKTQKDIDIATSATPEEMEDILCNNGYVAYETGLKHGTITFRPINSLVTYEITTFRKDLGSPDGRHPDSVEFTTSIEEDLKRRDFTMNAIAWNPVVGIVDPFGGLHDINHKIIKCVGDPNERFREDYLRVMRAIRFSACLGFEIDEETGKAIKEHYKDLYQISKERISDELKKMFSASSGKCLCRTLNYWHKEIAEIIDCDHLEESFEFDQESKYHDRDLFTHTLDVVASLQDDYKIRLAALFHDLGKISVVSKGDDGYSHYYKHEVESEKIARETMTNLRFSNDEIDYICFLVANHDSRPTPTKRSCRKFIVRCNHDEQKIADLIDLMRADTSSHSKEWSIKSRKELEESASIIYELLEEETCFSLRDLLIDGNDLKPICKNGVKIGEILNHLFNLVIEEKIENNRDSLLSEAKSFNS